MKVRKKLYANTYHKNLINLHEYQEMSKRSQLPSLMPVSLSLKETWWSSDVTIPTVGLLTSSGTCSTMAKASSFSSGESNGDSVTQTEGQVILSEGTSLTVNCSYETKLYPYLFWYVQYPREGPELLLKVTTANTKGSSRGFEATYDTGSTSFHLQKALVQESDSAVYYCALGDTVSQPLGKLSINSEKQESDAEQLDGTQTEKDKHGESHGEQLEQQPSTLNVGEGDNAIINCTYTGSGSSYFPWYKQEAGKSPHLVIDILENVDRKKNERFTILLDKKAKQLSLHITATQPGDSAIYFCAASTHWFPGTFSLFSNLLVGLEPHSHPVSCGRTHGDSVTQTGGQVTISEGGFLTINCTYSITTIAAPALF
ncbi:hypothetical protein STEG23_036249, partial [Scotinomys teguina]